MHEQFAAKISYACIFSLSPDRGRVASFALQGLRNRRMKWSCSSLRDFTRAPGNEDAVAVELRDVLGPSREEPGCLNIHAFRSTRDPRLFYIHSRWKDEAAFENHAELPHTVRFLERVEPLIDHPFDVTRAERIG